MISWINYNTILDISSTNNQILVNNGGTYSSTSNINSYLTDSTINVSKIAKSSTQDKLIYYDLTNN